MELEAGTEVETDDAGAVGFSWLVQDKGCCDGAAGVLLGGRCRGSSTLSTSRCLCSGRAVVSEGGEERGEVTKLRDLLCVAGTLVDEGKGRLLCVCGVREGGDLTVDAGKGTGLVLCSIMGA